MENYPNCPNFALYLPEKNSKITEFYMISARKIKNTQILHDIWQKNFFPIFWAIPLPRLLYACVQNHRWSVERYINCTILSSLSVIANLYPLLVSVVNWSLFRNTQDRGTRVDGGHDTRGGEIPTRTPGAHRRLQTLGGLRRKPRPHPSRGT